MPSWSLYLLLLVYVGCSYFIYVFVLIYVCWYPTRFPYHSRVVSYNSYITGVTSGAGTANPYGESQSSYRF